MNNLNEQWEEWTKIDEETLKVAMSKSKDYSPSNILGMGDVGVTFTILSKTIRLCNLMGIGLDVKFTGMKVPESPNNESIDDNFLDLRNYGQIAMILRRGKWGK